VSLVIQTQQLSKKYKGAHGLMPTDFKLYQGQICALIGRNGAGKSTFFKLLAHQIEPDSGQIELFGQQATIKQQTRKRIGFMIEQPTFIGRFTAFQNLKYFSIQRGMSSNHHIHEVLRTVELDNVTKKFKAYSLGMKQRLGLALALLNGPDLLVLDEPINGLDAQGIKDFRNLILRLNQEHGITILLSSHILSELQQVAQRFVFIEQGQIMQDITKEELNQQSAKQLVMTVDDTAHAAQVLEEHIPGVKYNVLQDDTLIIFESQIKYSQINTLMFQHGVTVYELSMQSANLEDYFLKMNRGGKND
jgi:ABC-2 type transport system ATP-binding protein